MFFKSFLEGPICQTCICFYFLALYIPYIVNSVMVLAELNQLGILALGLHPVAGFFITDPQHGQKDSRFGLHT